MLVGCEAAFIDINEPLMAGPSSLGIKGGFLPPTITGFVTGKWLTATFKLCASEVFSVMGPMA